VVVVVVLLVVGALLVVVVDRTVVDGRVVEVVVVVGGRVVFVVDVLLIVVELVPVEESAGLTHAMGTAHLFATNLPGSSRDGALQVEQYRSDPTVRMTPRLP